MKPTARFARWNVEPSADAEEESWLLTYLDVITLLLVMMVVLLAYAKPASETAAGKAEAEARAQAKAQGKLIVMPQLPQVMQRRDRDPLAGLPLNQLGGDVQVLAEKGAVRLRISSEILFESGEASLAGRGPDVLAKLIPILNARPGDRVVVEGHTDNVPIQTERFPSNWELSTGRAASVARHLIERGLDPARVTAAGYADTRPLKSNESRQERAQNRRVELVIESGGQEPSRR